ncbi:AsmA family protein [Chitinimonas arctica]|uniref:AsmA family protein n=1 Tax=Chitinimonas arctica TaxID=2594795 RepID=A0A516SJN0_9NEIS|nr:AsmA family protein [Chitinimonas arctica]QDQ28369.1 AsmA family protein [Chitinimonas arctica]
MQKAIKYTLLGFGGVVLLTCAGAAYLAATFDPNALKPQIEALVKEKKQRTLKLGGPISLSFFPSLGARMSDLSLSEYQSDRVFASVGKARVALQLWPLLNKRVVVDTVELDGADIRLARDEQGRFNFADLLQKDPEQVDAPVDFDISTVRVKHVQLAFDDKLTKRQITLSELALAADGLNPQGAKRLDFSTFVKSSQPAMDIKLSSQLGKVEFNRQAQRYMLANLAASIEGKLAGSALRLNLDAPRLALEGERADMEAVSLNATLDGDGRKLNAKLKLAGLSGDARQLAAKSLKLELDARQGAQTTSLELESPLALDLRQMAVSLPKLQLRGKASGGAAKDAPFELGGHLAAALQQGTADAVLHGQVDGADFKLDASARTGAKGAGSTAVKFNLRAGKLDLDRYFPPAKAAAAQGGPAAKLDLSALRTLDLDGKLAIAYLKKAPFEIRDLQVSLNANKGLLSIPSASMKIFGGQVTASASATATANPRITLRPRLENVDIQAALSQLAHFDRLEGRGFVNAELSMQGGDANALKASLDGTLRAKVQNGALRGINLAKTLREAKSTLANLQGGQQTVNASQTEKTDFTELSATLQFANGIAHNQDLSIKSPLLRVGGEGQADLPHETLDYLIKASLVNTSKGQDGKERSDLSGLTVPVRVTGPFAQPSYALDLTAALKENAGAKLDEQKASLREKAVDQLKKGLGNLFK